MGYYMNDLLLFQDSKLTPVEGIPIDLSNWTFGQLVAVTVWAPPLFQYAYLEISKSHLVELKTLKPKESRLSFSKFL